MTSNQHRQCLWWLYLVPDTATTGGQNKPAKRTRSTASDAVSVCETRKRQLGLETVSTPEAPTQRGSESNK